jgi:hypothetical protein
VKRNFHIAGVKDGKYKPQPGLNLTLASLIIAEGLAKGLNPPTATTPNPNYITLGNSWYVVIPALSGDFSDVSPYKYIARAYIAFFGYLQLVAGQAIYPEIFSGSSDELTVSTKESLVLHFSGAPPAAFWSLSLYLDNYLIPNPLNRFSLHAESNITYEADGSFNLLLQAANIAPPSNWTSNWLPAPSGGGTFSANCKL